MCLRQKERKTHYTHIRILKDSFSYSLHNIVPLLTEHFLSCFNRYYLFMAPLLGPSKYFYFSTLHSLSYVRIETLSFHWIEAKCICLLAAAATLGINYTQWKRTSRVCHNNYRPCIESSRLHHSSPHAHFETWVSLH